MEKICENADELKREAVRFALTLTPKTEHATLVTLSGELGAGKTTFVQGVAKTLGIVESVTSPTFVLEKIYTLMPDIGQGFSKLVHIDAYRLSSGKDLRALGFEALLHDPKNLIMLEWPELVSDALPEMEQKINLMVEGAGRKITYHGT